MNALLCASPPFLFGSLRGEGSSQRKGHYVCVCVVVGGGGVSTGRHCVEVAMGT